MRLTTRGAPSASRSASSFSARLPPRTTTGIASSKSSASLSTAAGSKGTLPLDRQQGPPSARGLGGTGRVPSATRLNERR